VRPLLERRSGKVQIRMLGPEVLKANTSGLKSLSCHPLAVGACKTLFLGHSFPSIKQDG
jgi:hypothetical protein